MIIQKNISLKNLNTFGIDVSAKYFAEISSVDELRELLATEEFKTNKRFILGGGSNILLTQDVDALVIKNNLKGIEVVRETDSEVFLKVGSGEVWHDIVLHTVEKNWGGIENLSLIPGSVGAAPVQNIGAYGVEVREAFENLEAINLESGELELFSAEDCLFGYRDSVFKNKLKDQYFITSVTFRLKKNPQEFTTSYKTLKETLATKNIENIDLATVSETVSEIRRSKLPYPDKIPNAGSFFKNPVVSKKVFDQLTQEHGEMPHHVQENGDVKLQAAWFIEQCGWKGKRVGNAGVHDKQALVLVNFGGATGLEIKKLSEDIQESVQKKFGVLLEPEVTII